MLHQASFAFRVPAACRCVIDGPADRSVSDLHSYQSADSEIRSAEL